MIKGFINFSLVDWDNKVSCVLFVGGCNFSCSWCQNFILVENPNAFENIEFQKIENYLKTRYKWIDGVVISGGEPTLYKEELEELLRKIKRLGFLTKLDTNGSNPEILEKIMDLVDFFAMDIKADLEKESYKRLTQKEVEIEKIKESIKIIKSSKKDYEFRTTLVPNMIDESQIDAIGNFLRNSKLYVLQEFSAVNVKDKSLWEGKTYCMGYVKKLLEIANRYLPTKYRGKNDLPFPHSEKKNILGV